MELEEIKNFLEIEELSGLDELAIQGGADKTRIRQKQQIGDKETEVPINVEVKGF